MGGVPEDDGFAEVVCGAFDGVEHGGGLTTGVAEDGDPAVFAEFAFETFGVGGEAGPFVFHLLAAGFEFFAGGGEDVLCAHLEGLDPHW